MTEVPGVCHNPFLGPQRPGSIGCPARHPDHSRPFSEMRVLDDEGREVPVGQTGEIGVRSPIAMQGYYRDEGGRPVPHALVELWQANAAGRYRHAGDQHDAPLDPNFTGCGRALTDADGRYRFVTIRPGAYPWRNHPNAWRPARIHFSLFGQAFCGRLVAQMYFPGDPLLPFDPMLLSLPDERARERLVAAFDWDTTIPDFALGYRFDIVLRGRNATLREEPR